MINPAQKRIAALLTAEAVERSLKDFKEASATFALNPSAVLHARLLVAANRYRVDRANQHFIAELETG